MIKPNYNKVNKSIKFVCILVLFITMCQDLPALVAGVNEPLEISTYEDITKWCTQIDDEYFIDKYIYEGGEIIHASILHSSTMRSSIDAIFIKKDEKYILLKKFKYVGDLSRKCIIDGDSIIVIEYGGLDEMFKQIDKIKFR